ncbi:hypothetical protein E2C01_080161 [Portunus trituberculatus]|uniref:Uncharacterized protein n=1 Tax=Portunus trituberculatus TaxID=210409 RepID=A0A5B7ILF7_PORTR|nr:hypothetical protein [Portunus trituberculatus]
MRERKKGDEEKRRIITIITSHNIRIKKEGGRGRGGEDEEKRIIIITSHNIRILKREGEGEEEKMKKKE